MDKDGIPLIGPGIKLEKIPPIDPRRTVALFNHFMVQTATLLNHFSSTCEERLEVLSRKLQYLEGSLSILESKLSPLFPNEANLDQKTAETTLKHEVKEDEELPDDAPSIEARPEPEEQSHDPRYEKYNKMVQVGVPIPAVKQKMLLEGLDPDLLGKKLKVESEDSGRSSSEESWSD